MAKEFFIFGRITGKGNPWSLETKRRMPNRSDADADMRRLKRVGTRCGRDVKLVHIEPQAWTPQAIGVLQDRGILPR